MIDETKPGLASGMKPDGTPSQGARRADSMSPYPVVGNGAWLDFAQDLEKV